MPVTPHFCRIVRHHHQMKRAGVNGEVAARAQVFLDCLIGLDGTDRYVEKTAHAMTPNIATTARTTMTMSNALFSWSLNGLNPIPAR